MEEKATIPSPPSSSYTLLFEPFDQANFISYKACEAPDNKSAYFKLHLSGKVSDSPGQRVARFQTVALVDEHGKVLSVVNHASQLSDET